MSSPEIGKKDRRFNTSFSLGLILTSNKVFDMIETEFKFKSEYQLLSKNQL